MRFDYLPWPKPMAVSGPETGSPVRERICRETCFVLNTLAGTNGTERSEDQVDLRPVRPLGEDSTN